MWTEVDRPLRGRLVDAVLLSCHVITDTFGKHDLEAFEEVDGFEMLLEGVSNSDNAGC